MGKNSISSLWPEDPKPSSRDETMFGTNLDYKLPVIGSATERQKFIANYQSHLELIEKSKMLKKEIAEIDSTIDLFKKGLNFCEKDLTDKEMSDRFGADSPIAQNYVKFLKTPLVDSSVSKIKSLLSAAIATLNATKCELQDRYTTRDVNKSQNYIRDHQRTYTRVMQIETSNSNNI